MIEQEKISLWQQIKEDFSVPKLNDPAFDSNFDIFFNYPGVWAIINYRVANRLYNKGFEKLSRAISGISSFFTKTDIHPAAKIGRRVFLDHAIGVVIGSTSIIEDDVLIYQGVTLGGVSLNKGKRHPTIKSNVVIGSGAKVLGNITIGSNSKIGANSVVVTDVPENSTAVGVPARIIRKDAKKDKLAHNELPDINKEMFKYLIERISILENSVKKEQDCNCDINEKNEVLEKEYNDFIEALIVNKKG
ncbi:serine O-acetyltransferase [Aliarcobacter trophiarum LMG 25534]|uniref:serine O-acetyltransferase n=1 Tax=Aliarcobacter trophiarum LMG 25534 TaxID=1032241 RepID=A0ABY0EUL6_9BACT|nr:serine O-acetyltransferase [Aliarcobacter trophiarum]RXJ89835.1 serine O-acetyltransferase [Aliarcobacter trophiarum LMG 25534]